MKYWIPCELSLEGERHLRIDARRISGHITGETRDKKKWIVRWGSGTIRSKISLSKTIYYAMPKIKSVAFIIGIVLLFGCYRPTLEDAQKANENMMRLNKDSANWRRNLDSIKFYYRIQANYLIDQAKKKN